jgi:hypothetical protein
MVCISLAVDERVRWREKAGPAAKILVAETRRLPPPLKPELYRSM